MVIGALFPQVHTLTFLIQYLLVAMLFLAFLDIDFKPKELHISIAWVLAANVLLPFMSYAALAPFDQTLALAAFITAIAPTAIAAPVMISFLQGKVEYVVAAVLATNIASALIIPVALPFLLGAQVEISVREVLEPVLTVMFVPLILAYLVRRFSPKAQAVIRRGKLISFPLWLSSLFIVSANASNYLRNENSNSISTLLTIATVSLAICVLDFGLGALLGGPSHWQEASQSLGQKNLSFVIWIALTFINPLVAMGPMFYILYHHLYNSWSIYRYERRKQTVLAGSGADETLQA